MGASGRARSSRSAAAAGDPRRRHQRQGLDHRLHARDPGGGGHARARLHLAASGALQRALPLGRRARDRYDDDELAARSTSASAPMPARPITVFEITTAAGSCCSRAIRPMCCCSRSGLGGRLDATNVVDGRWPRVITPVSFDHAEFLGDTLGRSRRRRPASSSAACRRSWRRSRARRAVIERQAARRGADQVRRRALDGYRGARTPGLSGRRRAARSAGAEALRPPSVRECRRRHRHAARGRGSRLAARGIRDRDRQGRLAGAHAAAVAGTLAALAPAGGELWLDGGHNADGGRAIANALADLEERVSRPLVLVVGMLRPRMRRLPARNFTGLARRVGRCRSRSGQEHARRHDCESRARCRHSGAAEHRRRSGAGGDWRSSARSAAAHPDHRLALSCRDVLARNGTPPM